MTVQLTIKEKKEGNNSINCLSLADVSKIYEMGEVKVHALENVTLNVPKGELIVILGPSGSGKTTLLNLVGAIDTPTKGKIIALNQDITNLNRKGLTKFRREHIGFIFQFFNLLPTLTALENVEYALQIQGIKGEEARKRALTVIKQVNLQDRANHFPSELSGGEQQRVAIARALAKAPEIILADEPTGELDFETGIMILELLKLLVKEGHTVVMVTHNSDIAKLANRIVRLRSGKIISDEENPNPIDPKDLRW